MIRIAVEDRTTSQICTIRTMLVFLACKSSRLQNSSPEQVLDYDKFSLMVQMGLTASFTKMRGVVQTS